MASSTLLIGRMPEDSFFFGGAIVHKEILKIEKKDNFFEVFEFLDDEGA